MSHPSLGLPPRSLTAGHPAAAERLRADRARIAARALEVAIAADPTLRERHDELALRNLLRDAEVFVDRLALCVAGNEVHWLRSFAEQATVVLRRRSVPLDDAARICDALRVGARALLDDEEMVPADAALDATLEVLGWHRRLAGDARRRNRLLQALYKGA